MKNEKIAIIALVVIIAGALSVYLTAAYYPDIFENLFEEEEPILTIEMGDLADVHYIGKYASNDTIFDSSYDDPENKTGGSPLEVFVTLNSSETPPDEYSSYSNIIGQDFVQGFIEDLVGLKTKQTATIGPLPPEKAYGVSPKVGDVINLSGLGAGNVELKTIEIKQRTITIR